MWQQLPIHSPYRKARQNVVKQTETSIVPHTYNSTDTQVGAELVPAAQVAAEGARAAEVIAHAQAPNTRRAYESSWRAFEAWCAARSIPPAATTPEIVAVYLTSRLDCGLSVRGIVRAYSALASRLRELQPTGPWLAGMRPEILRRLIQGASRDRGRPVVKKAPLTIEHFAQLADPTRFDASRWLQSARNRALLLIGFAGGFRRSELVALDVGDVEFVPEGAVVTVRRSKTDQVGNGAQVAIWRQKDGSRCPVVALETYMRGARITAGPIFRPFYKGTLLDRRLSDRAVAMLVKAAVASLGLDPALYSGHSLRSGFVTTAAGRGNSLDEIMNTTRHRSPQQVLGYIRRASPFDRNASKDMFEK